MIQQVSVLSNIGSTDTVSIQFDWYAATLHKASSTQHYQKQRRRHVGRDALWLCAYNNMHHSPFASLLTAQTVQPQRLHSVQHSWRSRKRAWDSLNRSTTHCGNISEVSAWCFSCEVWIFKVFLDDSVSSGCTYHVVAHLKLLHLESLVWTRLSSH